VELFGIPVVLGGKQVGSLGLYHDVSMLVHTQPTPPAIVEQPPVEEIEPKVEVFEPPAVEEPPVEVVPARRRPTPIEKIEGIGPVYGLKLFEIGVKTTEDLLNRGKDRVGRQELVDRTGISPSLILKWVNMADLMRIKGVGEEYSELLEKAGVDTVKELRNRVPKNLYDAMVQANEEHKLVRRVPHLSEVESWVKAAKESEPIMTY
jgi:predicted flap endonuclease-1-like 5' DNA nuclease